MPNINLAFQWAVKTCNSPTVGYSQAYRNQRTVKGITYYDCSSFIWYALIAGGFDCVKAYGGETWPFVTSTMGAVLENLGFVKVDRFGELKAGDIGVNGSHTEMYYEGGTGTGVTMGAHSSSYALERQVSINTYSTRGANWTAVYRYGGGATGGPIANAYVVAAMCGCFKRESNVNPGVWESLKPTSFDHQYAYDGIGGYGLGQWTNVGTPHGRCWNLHEWVTSNGYADGDGNGQLAFLIHEAYWSNSSQTRGNYHTLDEFLSTDSTDLDNLVWDFLANWEGVPGNAYSERLEAAERFLDYIIKHQNDDPSDYTWISTNSYLSWKQMYNNAMCIYFWFSDGEPIPSPINKRKGIPLWMLLRYLP